VDLSEDQEKVFKKLDDLFGKEEGWVDLESPYADVEMWIKYQQQARGERSIALGKAEGVAKRLAHGTTKDIQTREDL